MGDVTLAVYFGATGEILLEQEKASFNTTALFNEDQGEQIQSHQALNNLNNNKNNRFKIGFNGCGIINPITGTIFGSGLEAQCKKVIDCVHALMTQGKKVKLEITGASRGGIAGLMLAKKLGGIDPSILTSRLRLFDPVPGNLVTTPLLDYFDWSLAAQVINMEKVYNLDRVVSLYSQTRTKQLFCAFFAPIRPLYPKTTTKLEKTLLGDHNTVISPAQIGAATNTKKATPVKFELYQHFFSSEFNREETAEKITSSFCYDQTIESEQENHQLSIAANEEKELELSDVNSKDEIVIAKDNLTHFLLEVKEGMSDESKNSSKGDIFNQLIKKCSSEKTDDSELESLLYRAIFILLQRDRNPFSFFNTTRSGEYAVNLLNQDQHITIRHYLLALRHSREGSINYNDLRIFSSGENSPEFFNAKNREKHYNMLKL